MKIKRLLIVFILLFASIFAVSSFDKVEARNIEAEGDQFYLIDESYDGSASFVFSTLINFKEGQAAGLVFGAKENEYYWVFNMDRYENKVKLMYFHLVDEVLTPVELKVDYFIGNDKMTEKEANLVNPKVRELSSVHLKVVVTVEEENTYLECYADGIKRFGVDNDILLNKDFDYEYVGGILGYNGFNSKYEVSDEAIGESDYSYYSELYRQQYHYSQHSHWNNDPNGLVYYKGYYHLYFQHHPFNKLWGDMYWGHARSKDLVYWENLPICLFPEEESEFGPGNGYMWSGSARVYHKGESLDIDELNWFPNGNGDGLIAFFTRDGGNQDQVLISSDDEGMTWTKRVRIPQSLVGINERISCRDPKIFEVLKEGNKVTLWGMTVSNMEGNKTWFLKSSNLLDWSYAGEFNVFRPECIDILRLTADDNESFDVMTFSSREYIVGKFSYNQMTQRIVFTDLKGRDISSLEMAETQVMDYGKDSYAAQTFFIDDNTSKYYQKAVGLSWFSGVPGAEASVDSGVFQQVRSIWNGGGMTIPVEFNLVNKDGKYLLSQTPITKNNNDFRKQVVVEQENINVTPTSSNILQGVNTNRLELDMRVNNPTRSAFAIRVSVGKNEYTEIGWNKDEGYYVDRTHTSDAGISFHNYHRKYISYPTTGTTQSIYLLVDNGSVEVFCEDYTIPFYVLTLASPTSTKAEFITTGDLEITSLKVNEIGSIWKDESLSTNEGMLYVDKESILLDTKITTSSSLMAYSTINGEIEYSILEGETLVSLEKTDEGVNINALASGNAKVQVKCNDLIKIIDVEVLSGSKEFDLEFNKDGVVSGNWYQTSEGLIGHQISGDGFILSNKEASDVSYSTSVDLGDGAAVALVFRAKDDMSDYLIANYDKPGNIVKLWSPRGEIGNASVHDVDIHNINLEVIAKGNNVVVKLNGNEVINVTLDEDEPISGFLGLNVCATKAIFKEVSLGIEDYEYEGGDLIIKVNSSSHVNKVYNVNLQNTLVPSGFISQDGRNITISKEYFKTLNSLGKYTFRIESDSSSNTVNVEVKQLPELEFNDTFIEYGLGYQVFIGYLNITSLTIRHQEVDDSLYEVKDNMLIISKDALEVGTNKVYINDYYQFEIEVLEEELDITITETPIEGYIDPLLFIIPAIVLVYLVIGGVIFIINLKKKKVTSYDD